MINPAEDLERRNLSFSQSKVREVLPEYFQESYPNLLLFLEKYYEYLEGENRDSFKTQINNLFVSRDPEQTDEASLDFLVEEFGNGIKSSSFFDNPRLMTALLAKFYRVKGSLASIEGFFRGFFGENVVVDYPKRDLFTVGDSKVGYESLKFIQDNALYQTFSLLIKTPFSTADWRDLYLKFVHPAGFYYEGQVITQTEKVLGLTSFSEDPLAVLPTALVLSSEGFITLNTAFTETTALWDSNGDTLADYRFNISQIISAYKDVTLTQLDGFYDTIATLVTPNSFTFDNARLAVNDSDMANFLLLASLGDSTLELLLEDESDGAGRILGDINNTGTLTAGDAGAWNNYLINGSSSTYAPYIDNVFKPRLLSDTVKFAPLLLGSGLLSGADFSLSLETMDNDMFTRYLSDSTF